MRLSNIAFSVAVLVTRAVGQQPVPAGSYDQMVAKARRNMFSDWTARILVGHKKARVVGLKKK